MLDNLNEKIFKSSCAAERYGLEAYSNTEISAVNRELGIMMLKPRGLDCSADEILQFSLVSENSSCAVEYEKTYQFHRELYAHFPSVNSIMHTHAEWISLQSNIGTGIDKSSYGYIPSFDAKIPCTEKITGTENDTDCKESVLAVINAFSSMNKLPPEIPAVFLRSNGALVFGATPLEAAENAVTLEYASKKAFHTRKFM